MRSLASLALALLFIQIFTVANAIAEEKSDTLRVFVCGSSSPLVDLK